MRSKGRDDVMKLNLKDYGWNEVEGTFVLYSIKEDAYFALNDVAKDIWEFMFDNDEVGILEIIDFVKNKYKCPDNEMLEQDVKAFIEEMSMQNIIKV